MAEVLHLVPAWNLVELLSSSPYPSQAVSSLTFLFNSHSFKIVTQIQDALKNRHFLPLDFLYGIPKFTSPEAPIIFNTFLILVGPVLNSISLSEDVETSVEPKKQLFEVLQTFLSFLMESLKFSLKLVGEKSK